MRTRAWPPPQRDVAELAVVGGSGLYHLGRDVERHVVETPYGPTSAPIEVTELAGRRVAFLARHGVEHTIPAHRVNARANLWALHALGARGVIAPCSVGSLDPAIGPGELVVLDDLIDRTHGRADTFFDGDDEVVQHVSFARPYDERLRMLAVDAGRAEGATVHARGTVVVVNGPRFSTRAESRWFAAAGGTVVNMTQYPEAVLAAELGLPYVGIALVTDRDAGIGSDDEPVTMEQVLAVMRANVDVFRRVLVRLVGSWAPPA